MAAVQAGGGEPKGKRARSAGVDAGAGGGSKSKKKVGSGPATAPASASAPRAQPESAASSSLVDVTVEDADALDCGVCSLPLKPPIFQCDVGHVVCSPCHDKLKATGKCHVCGIATGSYHRCHDMEQLLDSIHVPCPYAPHGCAMRPAYHNRESHRRACVHAPCHCPGESCSFVDSKAALLDHFMAVYSWPCNTNICADNNGMFDIRLQDGFNFLLTDCPAVNRQGATTNAQCLLFLIVVRQPYARTISVHCIDPHAAATSGAPGSNSNEVQCEIWYSTCMTASSLSGGNQLIRYFQTSGFRVACTDLSNGLPKPDDCFQIVVPNSVSGNHDKDGIKIRITMKLIGVC